MRPTRSPPQLIQAFSYRRTVKPAFGVFILGFGIPPQLQKNFNGKFLRACGIPDNHSDDPGSPLVLSAEGCVEIEGRFAGPHVADRFAWCVHISITPVKSIL